MWENAVHNKDDSYSQEKHIVKVLADAGDKVIFLPEINLCLAWGQKLRDLSLPKGVNEDKSPDAFINGKHIVEFKTSKTNEIQTTRNLLKTGFKQADIVCVKFIGEISEELKKSLKGYANVSERIKEVWLIDQNAKLVKYTKEEMLNFYKSKREQ